MMQGQQLNFWMQSMDAFLRNSLLSGDIEGARLANNSLTNSGQRFRPKAKCPFCGAPLVMTIAGPYGVFFLQHDIRIREFSIATLFTSTAYLKTIVDWCRSIHDVKPEDAAYKDAVKTLAKEFGLES